MRYTTTQTFDYAVLSLRHWGITDDEIWEVQKALEAVFGKDSVHEVERQQDPDGDYYVSITLQRLDGRPYYTCECEISPGYPARTYGDPYDCYPGEPTSVDCYQDTLHMLNDLVDLSAWDVDVDDEECDTEEWLLQEYVDSLEPDPDEEYERHRDEGY